MADRDHDDRADAHYHVKARTATIAPPVDHVSVATVATDKELSEDEWCGVPGFIGRHEVADLSAQSHCESDGLDESSGICDDDAWLEVGVLTDVWTPVTEMATMSTRLSGLSPQEDGCRLACAPIDHECCSVGRLTCLDRSSRPTGDRLMVTS